MCLHFSDQESVLEVDPIPFECLEAETPDAEFPNADIPEIGIPDAESSDEVEEALIAEALGEPTKDTGYGDEIHPNLALVMETILENGFTKAEKEKIVDLKIPNNCKLLEAPKLNLELNGILTSAAKTRDKLLQERQQELGQSAAKIAQAIQSLSRKEFSKGEVIKKLGESSRLICNIHFQYTNIRRKLISPFLDRNLTESLKENRRGENLYSNLEDSVKSFSTIKRAVNVIKPKNMANKTMGNNTNKRESKNYQQPRRQQYQYNNQGKRGAYHQRPQYHQQRQAYKPPDSRHQAGPSNRGRAKYP